MQFFQEGCWVEVTGFQENKSCSKVLNFPERVNDKFRCTHEETVAVVKPWEDIGRGIKVEPPSFAHIKRTGNTVLDCQSIFIQSFSSQWEMKKGILEVLLLSFQHQREWKLSFPHHLVSHTLARLSLIKNWQHRDQNFCPHQLSLS